MPLKRNEITLTLLFGFALVVGIGQARGDSELEKLPFREVLRKLNSFVEQATKSHDADAKKNEDDAKALREEARNLRKKAEGNLKTGKGC